MSDDTTSGALDLSITEQEILIDTLRIDAGHQRRGFARGLLAHMDLALKPLGYTDMSLSTLGDGGYAWAALGFDLDTRYGDKHELMAMLVGQREATVVALEARAPNGQVLADRFRSRAAEQEFASLQEMSRFGAGQPWLENGSLTWFGRELLRGSQWLGRRPLGGGDS